MKRNLKTILAILIFFLVVPTLAQAVNITDGLVHGYLFNQSSGNAIDVIDSHDLTITGTVVYVGGQIDNASNNGATAPDDYLKSAITPLLSLSKLATFTYSFWIKRNGSVSGNDFPIDIRSTTGTSNYYRIQLTAGDELIGQGAGAVQTSFGVIANNTWYHGMLVSYGNDTVSTYLDGVNVNNGTMGADGAGGAWITIFSDGAGNEFSGSMDEVFFWNRSLNATEVLNIYDKGVLGNGYSWAEPPIANFSITATDADSNALTNFTAIITGDENYTTSNGTIITNILDNSTSLWNITITDSPRFQNLTVTDQNVSSNLVANLTKILQNRTETFDSFVLSNSSQDFSIDFVFPSGYLTNITNVTFSMNGTNTTANFTLGANSLNANVTGIIMPIIAANFTVFNFTWYLNAESSTGDFNDSYTNSTTVFFFDIDNCSVYTTTAINITVQNESNDVYLISNVNMWTEIIFGGVTIETNKSFVFAGATNYSICISPAWSNATLNSQLEYDSTGYATKLYYLKDFVISNVTKNVSLFLTNGTTQVTITVTDFDDSPLSEAIVKVLSYDFGTNTYTTTEILETNSQGVALAQLVLNTQWYTFIVEIDGVVKLQTQPSKILTSAITLRVDTGVDYYSLFSVANGISSSLSFTDATNTFSFVFSDPSGSMTQACLTVNKQSSLGTILINSSCSVTTAGTILIPIYENTSDNVYEGTGTATVEGSNFVLQKLTKEFNEGFKAYGLDGLFMTMVLVLTFALSQVWNPAVAVVFGSIGVLLAIILGLFQLSWMVVGSFVILAGITIYKLTRR